MGSSDDAIQRAVRARLTSFADDGLVATIEASAHKLVKRIRRALLPDRLVPLIEATSLDSNNKLKSFVLVYGKAKRDEEAVANRAVEMIKTTYADELPEGSFIYGSYCGNVHICFHTAIGVSYFVE